ncbi:hypothetical protein [Terracoccus sp. 273MFTsu3.1]|uniref:hypothetical protein n=1 Tax=Terracoccus sp. 273MFTsu3.1 TaxID=1172188 RepID=UPI00037B8F54|nr:hypothetical protein [Terracoccus sp. 273MFTsu3.1]
MGQLDGEFHVTNPNAKALYDFVRVTFDSVDSVKVFTQTAGMATGMIEVGGPIDPLWLDVLRAAGKQRLLRKLVAAIQADPNSADPGAQALMLELLAEPEDATPAEASPPGPQPAAAAAVAAMAAAVDAVAADIYDEGLLWKDMPFIGRDSLRESLKLMVPPAPHRSLLVIGNEGSGKTWTRQFLRYLKENGGSMQLRPIDMSLRAGLPVDERELASLVADALLGKEPPTFDPTAQPEAVVSRMRIWLSGELEDSTRPIWLVLDGFTPKTATAGAIQLVNELAQAAANGELGPVHVIVLGYNGNPALTAAALCEALAAPTRDEVKEFFARAALALQGTQPADAALEQLVDRFDAKHGPLATTPISRLGPLARERALTLFRDEP